LSYIALKEKFINALVTVAKQQSSMKKHAILTKLTEQLMQLLHFIS
jgi:hypothetical protein